MKKRENLFKLVSSISIEVHPEKVICSQHYCHDELTAFINALPKQFKNSKLDIVVDEDNYCKGIPFDLDKFCRETLGNDNKTTFNSFIYLANGMEKNASRGIALLFTKTKYLTLDKVKSTSVGLKNFDIDNSSLL